MAGLSLTLNTAEQTLLNTQLELQTSSHNIANANNTWYSKQTAVQQDNPAIPYVYNWIGTGASVTQITQARNQFLEGQLMNSMSGNSQYSSLATELQTIQSAAADSGDSGISQALGNFFTSWDTLSQNPSGTTQQSSVYQAAQSLASSIQSTYARLNDIATNDIPAQIQDTVSQSNTLIDQIAQLNTEIAQGEAAGGQENDLRDSRYKAMDDLSKLIPVSFTTNSAGMVTVTTQDTSGPLTIVSGATGTHITNASTITGGQFGGLLQAQSDLNVYMGRLDTFASSLISQVNTLHGANGGPAVFTGTNASTIASSNTFLNGQTPSNESSRALSLAGLQGTQSIFADGKTATLGGYLSDFQQQIGTDVQQANTNQSFNQALQTQLQTQQQSYSGVSMDEEMVNVIQLQQIYQAAAKVVETTSNLMNTAISMVH